MCTSCSVVLLPIVTNPSTLPPYLPPSLPPSTPGQSQVSGADKQQLADLQSLLCATLQSLMRKVNREDALSIAPTVMQALLLMFQSSAAAGGGGVLEDAIMTVGVLVEGEVVMRCHVTEWCGCEGQVIWIFLLPSFPGSQC